jgi:hypothetical protein
MPATVAVSAFVARLVPALTIAFARARTMPARHESCSNRNMAKKAKKAKKAKAKRSTGKRERLTTTTAAFYGKRSTSGRFKEMDEVGRSQKSDRRTKAKRKVRAGYGDRGDR